METAMQAMTRQAREELVTEAEAAMEQAETAQYHAWNVYCMVRDAAGAHSDHTAYAWSQYQASRDVTDHVAGVLLAARLSR